MDNDFNLIQALQDEWDAVSESPAYRAALGRWKVTEPALAGFDSPAEVVVWCRRHPDPREANQPVGALLRLAGDSVAARTLLQVLLPGLNIRIGRAAAKEAHTTFHDLRHYYASLLIRHGESVKVVQSRLGHASAKETLDTYSHLWPDSEDRTRSAVESVLRHRSVHGESG